MSKFTINLTDADFEQQVRSSQEPLVVVDFWAPWCPPCRQLSPVVDQIAEEFAGRVKVAKVNIDENQGATGEYGIRSIPTLLFFRNGELVDRHTGALPHAHLKRMIERRLDS